jgi:uncharacterized protein YbbC (DUF1343 family)
VGDTAFISRPEHLTRLAGTDRLTALLEQGARPDAIIESWQDEMGAFRDRRRPYLLY